MPPDLPVDPDFEELLEHLRTVRAADFTGYKRASLMRLVRRRMGATGPTTFRDYQDHLEVDPAEFGRLFDTMLVNVTSLFRDADTWHTLREEVLPQLLARLPDDAPVRVWVAACATGEEAYTLALVLDDLLGREAFRRRVKVYATDVDDDALVVARAGRYRPSALEAVPPDLRGGFDLDGEHAVFSRELRNSVIFGRHDLVQDAPISRIDVLSCRNVLMYLNHDTQSQVLDRFAQAVRPGGVLVLGRAETLLSANDMFAPLDLSRRVFTRSQRPLARQPGALRPERRGTSAVLTRAAQAAFSAAPEAQLVLDVDGVLTLVNDTAVRQLGVSPTDVGRPFQDLELSYRPVELRSAVQAASGTGEAVTITAVPSTRLGAAVWYDVQVLPLSDSTGEPLGTQITFLDVTRFQELTVQLDAAHRELETAYEELQSSNEELETTNEELQSAVEELETTNEELQSTNEELETMNEELQSTNEELQTLNDELRERTGEVNQVNAYLESILMGLRGAVVVVDRELVVRVWNRRAESLWGLCEHEAQGRHFLDLDIGLPVTALRDSLRAVVAQQREHAELDVPARNRLGREVRSLVSISPLRGGGGEPAGAIVLMDEASPRTASSDGAA